MSIRHHEVFKEIPEERFKSKVRSTVVGFFAIALGVGLEVVFPNLPDLLLMLLVGLGFYGISQDLVRGFAGFLPGTIRSIRSAIKGNGQDAGDD